MQHEAMIAPKAAAVEWPTLGLIIVIYHCFLALTFFHDALPLWLFLPLAAWIAAWWSSVQHEIVHGHPTRNRRLNAALATPPIWLWLPFDCYRRSHLIHHRDEHLTDPLDDPETRYWTATGWRELGPIGRYLVELQSTLLGRLAIGPVWSIVIFARSEAERLISGEGTARRVWAWHMLWVALLLAWVVFVCKMPLWQYLAGFVYCGTALALVRSFAEHKARDHVDLRTAIVENSPLFGLLFLNNNLHVVHHRWPTVPSYRLTRLYRQNRSDILAANGGLVYHGYGQVFRRYLFAQYDHPVHPAERPALGSDQAGVSYPAETASLSQASVVENAA